jgi:DNA-directed RNA polymerase subunit N
LMIIPVRCFTCGKVIGDRWEEYTRRTKQGENPAKVLDELGMKRYCCRRMFISHVEVIDELLKYGEVAARKRSQAE